MNEALNNLEEIEFDEEELKKVARKYTVKTTASVITVIIAIALFAVGMYCFVANVQIADQIKWAEMLAEEKRYSYAVSKMDIAQRMADEKSEFIPVFRTGNENFWKKIEYYEKANGPLNCKALLERYYPDSKYPAEAKKYLENAKMFMKAYTTLQNACNSVKTYSQAYEAIQEVYDANPDYPEYLVLYFHLVATQIFDESPAAQKSVYEALEKKAPESAWLYSLAGTKALIANNEFNKALRTCPIILDDEIKVIRVKIYRMMGEYKKAGMLYDEYRDYDNRSEALDREMIILSLLQGQGRQALQTYSYYTKNLNNIESNEMLYVLWIAAIKTNDINLEKKITEYAKANSIPTSSAVTGYKLGEFNLEAIFLDGGSELN